MQVQRNALLFLFLSLPLAAQEIEDPGPHAVGYLDAGFPGSTGALSGRVYYPAMSAGVGTAPDQAGGPYPLVAFLHGWLGSPPYYDDLSTHIASWGFVVASIGTETGAGGTMQPEAQDTADMLAWLDGESNDPLSFYAGLVSDDDWSAVGHSMGGGALFYLIEDEPKVRTVAALQPWKGGALGGAAGGSANLTSWTGDVLIVGGSVDTTCPVPTMTFPYYQLCQNTGRAFHVEVIGMGHSGPTDLPSAGEPLASAEQKRLHRRFVTGFLRAEVKGAENLYVDLLGEGAAVEPVNLDARATVAVHWSAPSEQVAGGSVLGVAGVPGDVAAAAASLGTASIPTALGVIGLNLAQGAVVYQVTLTADGFFEAAVPTPPGFAGTTLYTQAVTLGLGHGGFTTVGTLVLP